MADFLASLGLGLGAASSSQPDNSSCRSVEDLQARLREVLNSKTTPTRVEHVNICLNAAPSIQFKVAVSDSENTAIESLNQIDPSLGSIQSSIVPGDESHTPYRLVAGQDVLLDGKGDKSTLRGSVALSIATALGMVDESRWIAFDESKDDAQGFKVMFRCADSCQEWRRQHKTMAKAVVGDYSQKEPSAELMSRPAFDCRGNIIITFSRRSISIKYSHSPLHRTVGQLYELYKPSPRSMPVGPKQKTPKNLAPTKKRRDPTVAVDEEGNPKKKRKKPTKNDEAHTVSQDGAAAIEPSEQAPAVEGSEGGNNDSAWQSQDTGARSTSQVAASGGLPFKVSPEESARRKDAAFSLLQEAGVEPSSLSADQFNIFSNQAPELQKESLNMLVSYGAERLRIVHPAAKDGTPATSTAVSPQHTTQGGSSNPLTTKELVPEQADGAPGRGSTVGKKRKRKIGATSSAEAQQEPQTPKRPRPKGKSRLACFPCKSRRAKCPREQPACATCVAGGVDCQYPPVKPRRKKSAALVPGVDNDDNDGDDDVDDTEAQQEEYSQANVPPEGASMVDASEYSQYPPMPVSNILSQSNNAHAADPGSSVQPGTARAPTVLAMPQAEMSFRVTANSPETYGRHLPNSHHQHYPTNMGQGGLFGTNMQPDGVAMHSTPSGSSSKANLAQGNVSPRRITNYSPPTASNPCGPPANGSVAAQSDRRRSGPQQRGKKAPRTHQTSKESGQNTQAGRVAMPSSDHPRQRSEDTESLSHAPLQQRKPPPKTATAMHSRARSSPFREQDHARDGPNRESRGISRPLLADHPLSRTSAFYAQTTQPASTGVGDGGRGYMPANNPTPLYKPHESQANGSASQAAPDSSRVAYEPYSQPRGPSDAPSIYSGYDYEYGAGSTGPMSYPDTSSTNASNDQSSYLNDQTARKTRQRRSQGYESAVSSRQAQPGNKPQMSMGLELDMRDRSMSSRPHAAPLHHQHGQSGATHADWFHLHNPSGHAGHNGNQGSDYSWRMSGDPWPGAS